MKSILVVLLLITVSSYSQEIEIIPSGKESFRIKTTDNEISSFIYEKMDTLMTRYSGVRKKDRMGFYWERSFYFKNESKERVVNMLKQKRFLNQTK